MLNEKPAAGPSPPQAPLVKPYLLHSAGQYNISTHMRPSPVDTPDCYQVVCSTLGYHTLLQYYRLLIINNNQWDIEFPICLPWQGITIVIPHTLGNTPKKLFLPGGHSSKSAGGNLVNPLSVLLPQSGAICGSKVEAKRLRESLQSQPGSKSDHRTKKFFFFQYFTCPSFYRYYFVIQGSPIAPNLSAR